MWRMRKGHIMKQMLTILMAAAVISSCGKKCLCPPEIIVPGYVGYNSSEIDTIVIKRFTRGSNFSQALDSIVLTANNSANLTDGDTTRIISTNLDFRITENYDWQIRNPFDNRAIQISEIEIDEQESHCGGLFSWDRQACTSPVSSFKKNGVPSTLDRGPYYSVLVIKK